MDPLERFLQLAYCVSGNGIDVSEGNAASLKRKSVDDLPNDCHVVRSCAFEDLERQALCLLIDVDVSSSAERGRLVLECAIGTGSREVVEAVLDKGVDVNRVDDDGRTALHMAIMKESTNDIVELLLDRGSDANAKDMHGRTSIHYATSLCTREAVVVLSKLLRVVNLEPPSTEITEKSSKGCKSTGQLININAQDNLGNTALHNCVLFRTEKEAVKLLIDHGADTRMKNKKDETAFQLAIKCVENSKDCNVTDVDSRLDILYLLLQEEIKNDSGTVNDCLASLKHSSKLNTINVEGKTLLRIAVEHDHKAIVSILLQYGADVGVKGLDSQTALHVATVNGDVELVNLLLRDDPNQAIDDNIKQLCRNVHAQSDTGSTALHIAAEEGCIDIVKLLLGSIQTVNKCHGFDCEDQLLQHITTDDTVTNKQTTGSISIGIDVKNKHGHTPLHNAVTMGNIDIAELLLKHGSNVNCKSTDDGFAAMHIAALQGEYKMARLLLNNGANVNLESNVGSTALHEAVDGEYYRMTGNMQNGFSETYMDTANGFKDMVELLLQNGADLNAQTENGVTPLYKAICFPLEQYKMEHAITEYVRKLELGTSESSYDDSIDSEECDYAMTALELADDNTSRHVPIEKFTIVEILLANGADIYNKMENNGNSAIQLALILDYEEIVKLMIKDREDVNYSDDKGRTVLMMAAKSAKTSKFCYRLVEAELNRGADVLKKDNEGLTALHHACSEDIFGLLLSSGANINAQSNNGATPLHYALREASKRSDLVAQSHKDNILDALFVASHRLDIKDNMGKTVIDYCNESHEPYINDLIELYKAADIMQHITDKIMIPTHTKSYDSQVKCIKEKWIDGICLYDILNYTLSNLGFTENYSCAEWMQNSLKWVTMDIFAYFNFQSYISLIRIRFEQAKRMPALLDKVSKMFSHSLSNIEDLNVPVEISHMILVRLAPIDLMNLMDALK